MTKTTPTAIKPTKVLGHCKFYTDKAVGSDIEAINILKQYAKAAWRFHESGYRHRTLHDADDLMVVGFVVEGNFGVGDNFFEAIRWLAGVRDAKN